MKSVTTHQAKTHLSRLIKDAQAGETITILNGNAPVAQLTAIATPKTTRPPVGTRTSAPVSYAPDAFAPLDAKDLKEWGL